MLQVTRPRVSDVVNHKVEKFTIDALVSMLGRIGKQVRLAVVGGVVEERHFEARHFGGERGVVVSKH